ncbi:hypothetical protein FEDK69T_31820 [Flavobacterium enshiense DK69]|nr:hypothetical protein FEDK69T_31820 [Flavobacterium enshiense DK69]
MSQANFTGVTKRFGPFFQSNIIGKSIKTITEANGRQKIFQNQAALSNRNLKIITEARNSKKNSSPNPANSSLFLLKK